MRKSKLWCLLAGILILFSACFPESKAPEMFADRPVRAAPANTPGEIFIPASPEGETDGSWPTRPITLIVPFVPGGDTDMYARMFAPFLAEILGQPVNVVNIDGASGNVGATLASTSTPDGYTMLFYHSGNLFTNKLVGASELRHDDFKIACIAMYCDANILLINAEAGINSADEFLEHIRAKRNTGA